MTLSPDQLARRLTGIAATDVAAVVGCNPYRSAIDVWREKLGESAPWTGNAESRWGERVEPILRAHYADERGVRVETPGTLHHPDQQWIIATPDGVAYPVGGYEPLNGLECKQHGWRMAHHYGDPGTDDIPMWEICQCVWNMAVTGLSRWDVIVVIGGPPVTYIIDRDEELIDILKDKCHRFLIDNVRGGAVPDPDGTESFDRWLKARWAKNGAELIDIANEHDLLAMIYRAKALREAAADADMELEAIKQKLKVRIADAAGLIWRNDAGKVEKLTWKRNKEGKRTDYAGIANDARSDARLCLSAKALDVRHAITSLESVDENEPIGSARDPITAKEVAELINTLYGSLEAVAGRTDDGYTKTTTGNRPMNFPTAWRSPVVREKE